MTPHKQSSTAIHPDATAAAELSASALVCYQCGKCSSGCPVAEDSDLLPHDLLRALQVGDIDTCLASQHIWLCIGCKTCVARCPNAVDLPRIIDMLRATQWAQSPERIDPASLRFHNAFLHVVKRRGRLIDSELLLRTGPSGPFFEDLRYGLKLLARGKLKLLPGRKPSPPPASEGGKR